MRLEGGGGLSHRRRGTKDVQPKRTSNDAIAKEGIEEGLGRMSSFVATASTAPH